MYEVVLQLSDEVAAEFQTRSVASREAQALLEAADDCDVSLTAQHPGAGDELGTYFSALVSDLDSAERVRERFATVKGVKAAYVKPPGEMP